MLRLSTSGFYISFEVRDIRTEKKNVFMTGMLQFVICNPRWFREIFYIWQRVSRYVPHPCLIVHNIDCYLTFLVLLLEANGKRSDPHPE